MQKNFNREFDSLATIFQFVKKFISENDIDVSNAYALNLAIEELFTNMVKYNPDSHEKISIELSIIKDSLIIELIDSSKFPFDISKAPEYDVNQTLRDRPIGGVGIHLIKKYFDDIKYAHSGSESKITLVKHLGETNV